MSRASLFVAALFLATCADAHACGRGGRGRAIHCRPACHARAVTYPYPSGPMYPASPGQAVVYAAAPSAVIEPAPSSPGVQPQYSYDAGAEGRPAYYYTYDDSGKLIIKQWGDWLLRGGIAAGMPMPPLPIIGRLRQ